MTNKLNKTFNNPDTLGIISSYPAKDGEIASENAISRYTFLLTKNFPKSQKVVIFCEKRGDKTPYMASENVLVVPTYRLNSPLFVINVLSKLLKFNRVRDILIQFEFSVFGGKVVVPQILVLLLLLKFFGKSTKIMFHQVVINLNTLYGHLAIKRNSLKTKFLNLMLRNFYIVSGQLSDKILVHDSALAGRMSNFVDSQKIKIIPHGLLLEKKFDKKFEIKAKKLFGVDSNMKLVGLFGYCSWYKGTDWLIENFARFAHKNPKVKVKLLVAGGESPTLRGTRAYKIYHEKLMSVIKKANGNIIYTGFVPEKEVEKVFAACDLMVFPYRTRMSASGALSLCLGYGKPFIASKAFSEYAPEFSDNSFNLTYKSFERVLKHNLIVKKEMIANLSDRTWANVAKDYMDVVLQGIEIEPKLEYAEVL